MTRPVPFTGAGANPLALYLRAEAFATADIEEDLRDAMADAQRRINKLETRAGIGSVVRRAQLQLVRRELRAVQETLWRSIGKRIRSAGTRIADAATEAEQVLQKVLFQSAGKSEPPGLLDAQRAYAQRTVASYLARGQNGIGLSQRVYRTRALSNGFIDRAINRSLLQGDGWQELAARVRPMIDPNVPGGVSYAAKRLARTELNNAFHTVQRESAKANPFVRQLEWHLSRSHPRPDACDVLAAEGPYDPDEVPNKPHPQCLCYTTNVMMDEDEFLEMVTSEEFLGSVEEDYGKVLPLTPDPKPAPKPAAKRQPTVAQLARRKPVDVQRLGGSIAYTDLNTYADGSKLVHKVNGDRAALELDPVHITDAEFLGAEVLRALDIRVPELHRSGDNELYMEFIPGELIGEKYGWNEQKLPASLLRSPEFRRMGLADYYMVQFDRNMGNVVENVAIDNGNAWLEGSTVDLNERSPFAQWLHQATLDILPEELAEAGRRLQGLRGKFEKAGRLDWWELSWARHEALLKKKAVGNDSLWSGSESGSNRGGGRAGMAG